MHEEAPTAYLEAAVQTATPQKLQLMLIEGAIRFATEAKENWCEPVSYELLEATRRCQSIIAELYGGIRQESSEVAKKTADLYLFLYREIVDVLAEHDPKKLDGVLEILEIERETWRQLCDAMPEAPQPIDGMSAGPVEVVAADDREIEQPTYGAPLTHSSGGEDGLSLEA